MGNNWRIDEVAETAISWTEFSWNPLRARDKETGKVGHFCEKTSRGCAFCYSSEFQKRFGMPEFPGEGKRKTLPMVGDAQPVNDRLEVFLDEKVLRQPLGWKKQRKVFVCSMTDLFGWWVSDKWLDQVFAVMALTPQHTYQVLTKRAERLLDYLTRKMGPNARLNGNNWLENAPRAACMMTAEAKIIRREQYGDLYLPCFPFPLPNVWLGVSAEDKRRWKERVSLLRKTPAAIRFVSVEPLLEDLGDVMEDLRGNPIPCPDGEPGCEVLHFGPPIDQLIIGGESGSRRRPFDIAWAESLRRQCRSAGVAYFFKQDSAHRPGQQGRASDELWNTKEFPCQAESI
ncbi:MAG: DUF5131 family protein [Patescibacteria group bacterium]|nr:DUF5131 family protein [Patescibacteria group bacterium]